VAGLRVPQQRDPHRPGALALLHRDLLPPHRRDSNAWRMPRPALRWPGHRSRNRCPASRVGSSMRTDFTPRSELAREREALLSRREGLKMIAYGVLFLV